MSIRKNIFAGIGLNIFIFGLMLIMLHQMDVFTQLLFSFAPIILSIVVATGINYKKNIKIKNTIFISIFYTICNFLYLILEYICMASIIDTDDIYNMNQKYNSGYITVSENKSPILSIILFSLLSFVLHYFCIKKVCYTEEK